MNIAFLASFIGLCLIISINIRKQARQAKAANEAFWERERLADSVRRKPLDGLDYIKIPLETFPTHLLHENSEVLECIDIMQSLSSQKIVNLTGYTNTDLKLEYGTANLPDLSEYDQNYTVLVRTLQKWADCLIDAGFSREAAVLMEFAVSTGTDVSRTYYRLAEYRISHDQAPLVDRLVQSAENLRSPNGRIIAKHLRESYPDVF